MNDNELMLLRERVTALERLVNTHKHLGFDFTQKLASSSITGTTTGFTAGSGTAVKDDSTFTGGVGSKAYRISDIILNLKNMGILAP